MADSELVDVDALMTDAANALGVTFGYNMSKESAEDYGELPDELLATPRLLADFYRSFKICIKNAPVLKASTGAFYWQCCNL